MDTLKGLLITSLCLLLLTSCSANFQGVKPRSNLPRDLLIGLERTGCFGKCPEYTVQINSQGEVIYEGLGYVEKTGRQTRRISRIEAARLYAAFKKINFFEISRDDLEDACDNIESDFPSMRLSLRANNRSHKVAHYMGCHGNAPILQNLVELGQRVDRSAGILPWVHANKKTSARR